MDGGAGAADERVSRSIAYMHRAYGQPLSVAEMAAHVHLSESRFRHLFHQRTGLAPMEYLIQLRLSHARRLMAETALSIAEIARAVGYEDPFYFSRLFRQKMARRPRSFAAAAHRNAAQGEAVAPGGGVPAEWCARNGARQAFCRVRTNSSASAVSVASGPRGYRRNRGFPARPRGAARSGSGSLAKGLEVLLNHEVAGHDGGVRVHAVLIAEEIRAGRQVGHGGVMLVLGGDVHGAQHAAHVFDVRSEVQGLREPRVGITWL